MSEFILVIYIYAGMLAKGDSVAIQPIYGFKTEAQCQEAGRKAEPLVKGSAKEYRFICMEQKK